MTQYSPPSQTLLTGFTHHVPAHVKLTALELETSQERLHQQRLESSNDQSLAVGLHGKHGIVCNKMTVLLVWKIFSSSGYITEN